MWEMPLQTQESLAVARVMVPSLSFLVSSCKKSGPQPPLLPLTETGEICLSRSVREATAHGVPRHERHREGAHVVLLH